MSLQPRRQISFKTLMQVLVGIRDCERLDTISGLDEDSKKEIVEFIQQEDPQGLKTYIEFPAEDNGLPDPCIWWKRSWETHYIRWLKIKRGSEQTRQERFRFERACNILKAAIVKSLGGGSNPAVVKSAAAIADTLLKAKQWDTMKLIYQCDFEAELNAPVQMPDDWKPTDIER